MSRDSRQHRRHSLEGNNRKSAWTPARAILPFSERGPRRRHSPALVPVRTSVAEPPRDGVSPFLRPQLVNPRLYHSIRSFEKLPQGPSWQPRPHPVGGCPPATSGGQRRRLAAPSASSPLPTPRPVVSRLLPESDEAAPARPSVSGVARSGATVRRPPRGPRPSPATPIHPRRTPYGADPPAASRWGAVASPAVVSRRRARRPRLLRRPSRPTRRTHKPAQRGCRGPRLPSADRYRTTPRRPSRGRFPPPSGGKGLGPRRRGRRKTTVGRGQGAPARREESSQCPPSQVRQTICLDLESRRPFPAAQLRAVGRSGAGGRKVWGKHIFIWGKRWSNGSNVRSRVVVLSP